ncbi:MAG: hypothetical protein ABSF11_06900 [Methylocella sp.]
MSFPIQKLIFTIVASICANSAMAQQAVQTLEPGIGYSRLKKWAIDSNLVFENYTKDAIVVRDNGINFIPNIKVFAHFCAGDDYAGKANNIIIQENFSQSSGEGAKEALIKERQYIELLAGAPEDEKFKGNYNIRPEKKDATSRAPGISIQGESEKGKWEVGVFLYESYTQLQTIRNKDAICN